MLPEGVANRDSGADVARFSQHPTPLWFAEAIIERYFGYLDRSDHVLEPCCGNGRFIQVLPEHVPATGIEIDPTLAGEAAKRTGRTVIAGDYQTVALDFRPTAIVGNPPFKVPMIEALMRRAREWLVEEGRMGLILPAFMFQTADRVAGYAQDWSIAVDMIPRNIYPGLRDPLVFAIFSKDSRRTLVGLALHREVAAVQNLPKSSRQMMMETGGALWPRIVMNALESLGGEANLEDIYRAIEGNRPTRTPFWREKIRQVCQASFMRTGRGRYAIPANTGADQAA